MCSAPPWPAVASRACHWAASLAFELSLRISTMWAVVPSHGGTHRGSARPPDQLLSQKALSYLGIPACRLR